MKQHQSYEHEGLIPFDREVPTRLGTTTATAIIV
jgi:hypothetical protein